MNKIIPTIILIVVILLIGASLSNAEEYTGSNQDLLDEWYSEVCPYGNVVITDKHNNKVSEADCVNFDYKTQRWTTWEGDVDRRKNFRNWNPKDVRMWVMDGKLIIKKHHPDVEFYGIMSVDDPRFPEWLKKH